MANNLKSKQQKYEVRSVQAFLSIAEKLSKNMKKRMFLAISQNFVKKGL
jgi:3-methyladenine DNA glycosylase Tag